MENLKPFARRSIEKRDREKFWSSFQLFCSSRNTRPQTIFLQTFKIQISKK